MAKQRAATRKTASKNILSAQQILEADDFDYAEVEVPEWGGVLRLRSLTAAQVHVFNKAIAQEGGRETSIARAIAMSAVDADGNRIFEDEQIDALNDKSLTSLLKAQSAFMTLNKMGTPEQRREAEEAAKKA